MQILELIDSAQKVPQDFEFFKSWKIHPLKGEWKGFWSLTVKENWRVVFRFVDQNALTLIILITIKKNHNDFIKTKHASYSSGEIPEN